MEMTIKYYLLLAALLFTGIQTTSAQKYGHMNFGSLIASLPETKEADKALEAYQKQLNTEIKEKSTAWQTRAEAFVQEVQGGNLAPIRQQEKEQALEADREKIIELQQSVQQKVQAKRQELLEPIVNKVEDAINSVAKENSYMMIFDTSVFNAILFAQDSDDVTELVKAKL
jgi:outer membrane protein